MENEIFIALSVLAVFIICLIIHTGYFSNVIVRADHPSGCNKVVMGYKYTTTNQQAHRLFKDVQYILPTYKKIYIDYASHNFQAGYSNQRAFAVGLVLNENGRVPDEDVLSLMVDLGYKIHTFPEMTHALVATYPYRSNCSLYIKIARSRVLQQLYGYITERKLCAHPTIEIYGDSTITYLAPLHRQDDFYVPEIFAGAIALANNRVEKNVQQPYRTKTSCRTAFNLNS